jgi:hypothetical protein
MLRSEILTKVYAEELAQIKRVYPKYVLFNSTFSQAYLDFGSNTASRQSLSYTAERTPEAMQIILNQWRQQSQQTLFSFLEFVRLFLNTPYAKTTKLVFRPHPSDDISFYKFIFQGIPAVEVVREYPIAPWIFSATAVIGSTCTTLVESAVIGVPTFAFNPKVGAEIDNIISKNISTTVSRVCNDPRELLEALGEVLAGGVQLDHTKRGTAQRYCEFSVETPVEQASLISGDVAGMYVLSPDKLINRIVSTNFTLTLAQPIYAIWSFLKRTRASRKYIAQKYPEHGSGAEIHKKISTFSTDSAEVSVIVKRQFFSISKIVSPKSRV